MEGQSEQRDKIVTGRLGRGVGVCIVFVFALFGYAHAASAASMYLAPSEKSVKVGDTFTVGVYVSSPDQAMNAVSGAINVSTDKLQITSVSKGGSIVSLWVREPSFSAGAGSASFEGIVLNPGFTGSGGNIITLGVKAIAAGKAVISFSSASVLANDGLGSNILKGLGSGTYTITDGAAPPPPAEPGEEPADEPAEKPEEEERVPDAPAVRSGTHPDPDQWYAANDASVSWDIPSGVTAVRILLSRNPDDVPSTTHSPAIGSVELTDLEEGVSYLHVRFRNAAGWGAVAHYRFQIDGLSPAAPAVTERPREDATQPAVSFTVIADEADAGVARYEMVIDGGEPAEWLDDGSHTYTAPALGPGEHALTVRAYDRAGNAVETSVAFRIAALDAPKLESPGDVASGDLFVVRGQTAYPDAQVTVWVRYNGDEPESGTVRTGADGRFVYVMEGRARSGTYRLWADVTDARGAKSGSSDEVTLMVRPGGAADLSSWLIPLLAGAIILLSVLLWRQHRLFLLLRTRLKRGERPDAGTTQVKAVAPKRRIRLPKKPERE